MIGFIVSIIANLLGLWLAVSFVQGIVIQVLPDSDLFGFPLTADWQIFLLLAIMLAILNYFLKPILDLITLPIRILTLGFASLIINMGMIWALGLIFKELSFDPLLSSLLWTTLIVGGCNVFLSYIINKRKK